MNQIVLEDENHRLLSKLTACEDYQLKYEMLLSKVNQENVLRRSREIDGAQVSENTIEENNHKWETKLAEIENIFQDKIMLLENTNRTLQK